MSGLILFFVFLGLLAAIWLLPIPHPSQFPRPVRDGDTSFLSDTDWTAYHRAGRRYSRRLMGLFLALVVVGMLARIQLEAQFEERAASAPDTSVEGRP